ncbi:Rgp1-domain-containing protein [Sordaria brevicollis]|uniref:Rgp1-domain-containing protein n=1 Tax=Sordaria brevicollis TaxID=83679 RepID=A0AAE0PCN7_SORBR|nr:Rgp1-domain-containing protein [Sordaria brevicollis]
MSPPDPSANSNIRVFVRWQDHVVFAGEEVKCTITFKNVARPPGPPPTTPTKNPHPSPRHLGAAAEQRLRQPSPLGPGHPVQSPATQGGGNARTKAHGHSVDGLAPPPSVRGRGHGHRSTLSLTVPSAAATSRARDSNSLPWSPIQNPGSSSSRGGPPLSSSPAARSNGNAGHGHKRSVSIVSLGSTKGIDEVPELSSSPVKPQRPGRGHARASSLQIIPRVPFFGGPKSGKPASFLREATMEQTPDQYSPRPHTATHPKVQTSQQQPSPLFHASYPPNRNTLHSPTEGPLTPSERTRSIFPWATSPSPKASPRADQNSEFRFPFTKSSSSPDVVHGGSPAGPVHEDNIMSPTYSVAGESVRSLPMRSRDQIPTINEHGAIPSARILSTTSIGGTPRSSGEFYSMSNHSSETLASEYVQSQPLRMAGGRSGHSRRPSSFSPNTAKLPESLMMGYAQIQGSFTLDGSLVNLGPFEQVKRKAVVGGHGGGVIGVETTKRDSGLLRGFGWGSITSSIGELLGGGELSTIKEMRGIASSKSIPLLSTPQSILFVDLQLAPGESKTFEYSFKLPKGLPPTHRGKAMKISYSLVIGTQRPGGAKDKHVKSVDVPFRVLGSVNNHGEILGHDLMAPYIILRDQARVQTVNNTNTASTTTLNNHNHQQQQPQQTRQKLLGDKPAANEDSFLTYVDELLSSRSLQLQNGARAPGLLSPTASAPPSRRPSNYSLNSTTSSHFNPFGPQTHMPILTAKEAIDLAILRSNIASHDSNQSTNRFEIARNGRRVAVVMLARPAYRLGEQITMAIDFEGAEIPCYAVHIALETAERVDSSLALRSEASVHRVTRKVLVSSSEATMFAKRVVFTPTIPVTATPEFVTSGVSLEWKVRVEFVVPSAEALERMGQSLVLGQASSQGQSQSQGIGMGLGITNNGEEEYEIVSDNEGGRNGVIEEVDEEETDNEEDEEEERETRLVKTNGSANPNKGKEKSRSRPPMLRKNQTLSERERERERNLMQLQAQQQQQQQPHPLLEEISRDDRGGLVLVAAENLICESFEVAVPLKIYGAVGTGLEKLERDEVTEEGLPV